MALKVFDPDNNIQQAQLLKKVWVIINWHEFTIYGAFLDKEKALEVQKELVNRGFDIDTTLKELNII